MPPATLSLESPSSSAEPRSEPANTVKEHKLLTCVRRGRTLRFRGAQCFRERLVFATLSARPVHIQDIRAMDESPGVRDFEASLLQLLEKLTNGSTIKISSTATVVRYNPGFIIGGNHLVHDCHPSRSIGYYLEALMALAPFAKSPLQIVLRGVVNDDQDTSPDIFRTVLLPTLKRFGLDEDSLELKIKKRGASPLGGGEVLFRCGVVKTLKAIKITDAGKVKRVRGVAYTARVSPSLATRVVDASRAVFNHFIPDVWVYTEHFRGAEAGASPGYAVSLVAESTTGCLLSAESNGGQHLPPEDLGDAVSKHLLQEIATGGCIDSVSQSLVLLFMALCPEDVSRVRFGKLSPHSVNVLRHLSDFFGVRFRLQADADTHTVLASCRGVGFKNLARKALA